MKLESKTRLEAGLDTDERDAVIEESTALKFEAVRVLSAIGRLASTTSVKAGETAKVKSAADALTKKLNALVVKLAKITRR